MKSIFPSYYRFQRQVEPEHLNPPSYIPRAGQIINFVANSALAYFDGLSSTNSTGLRLGALYQAPKVYLEDTYKLTILGLFDVFSLREYLEDEGTISILKQALVRNIPLASLLNSYLLTVELAKKSFLNIKESWENLPTLEATAYTVVHFGNLAFSIATLYAKAQENYNFFRFIKHSKPFSKNGINLTKLPEVLLTNKSDIMTKSEKQAFQNYIEFEKYKEIDPRCNVKLPKYWNSDFERIMDPRLDPSCPGHAIKMFMPNVNKNNLFHGYLPSFKARYSATVTFFRITLAPWTKIFDKFIDLHGYLPNMIFENAKQSSLLGDLNLHTRVFEAGKTLVKLYFKESKYKNY